MGDYSLHIADVAVAGLVLLSALIGLLRGFVKEVLSIFSWAVALFAGLYGHTPTFPFWLKNVDNEILAHGLAFGTIFLGVLTTCLIITARISDRVEDGALGGLDRTLGFGFGLVRGLVIVCLAYLLLLSVRDDADHPPQWLEKAESLPYINASSDFFLALLPHNISKDITPLLDKKNAGKPDSRDTLDKYLKPKQKNTGETTEPKKNPQNKSATERDEKASRANTQPNKSDQDNLDKLIETIQE